MNAIAKYVTRLEVAAVAMRITVFSVERFKEINCAPVYKLSPSDGPLKLGVLIKCDRPSFQIAPKTKRLRT
jgi:hypothetical protein